MAGLTKVKIRVADLIERVEEVKAEDEARFESEQAEFEQALEVWKDQVADTLNDAALDAGGLDYENDYSSSARRGGYIMVGVPEKPAKPKPVDQKHARTLRMLRMVTEETTAITLGDDLARYL